MRSDPSDNGGLFVGRRPGSQKPKYRALAEGEGRSSDRLVALLIASIMALLAVAMVLGLPLGFLYAVAQIPYLSERPFLALTIAFAGILLCAMGILSLLTRLDRWWVLVRRSAGCDQHKGLMTALVSGAVFIAAAGFSLWLIFGGGLASSPMGPQLP